MALVAAAAAAATARLPWPLWRCSAVAAITAPAIAAPAALVEARYRLFTCT